MLIFFSLSWITVMVLKNGKYKAYFYLKSLFIAQYFLESLARSGSVLRSFEGAMSFILNNGGRNKSKYQRGIMIPKQNLKQLKAFESVSTMQ